MAATLETKILLAVDVGSSQIKGVADGEANTFQFPNIIAQPLGKTKDYLLEMGNPIDFLEVKITSPAILDGAFSHVFVGNRAIGDDGVVHEIVGDRANQKKAQRPETFVALLTAAAYAVAKKHEQEIKNGVKRIRAKVYLGTSLPVGEFAAYKDEFQQKLVGVHTITFGFTPVFKGVTIELDIELPVGVQIDGATAVYDIEATSKTKLSNRKFGIADIGGVDMDILFFKEGLELDLRRPYATKIKLNDALESIRRQANAKKDLIHSTAELVERLVQKDYEIYHRGKLELDLRSILNDHLAALGEKAYQEMEQAWGSANYAKEFWFVGGGAIILKDWIEKANAKEKLPIFFDEEAFSQFRNVRGTFLLLQEAMKIPQEAMKIPQEAMKTNTVSE